LVDKDGKKVGKTTGNALFLDSTPDNFYAGIMSFPDETIALSFELLTESDLTGIEDKIAQNPMREKKRLAFEIVKLLWGEKLALVAQENFKKTFQDRKPEYNVEVPIADTLAGTISPYTSLASISDAKRLIKQNAVEVNEQIIIDPTFRVKSGDNIKVGNKTFLKVK
jgi:tyrosyl-tRNA synthetase